jgi:hypothetical protein
MVASLPDAVLCVPHPFNWAAGWGFVLAAFLSGAGIGMFFHRDGFLGGYASYPRRMLRLGHIALAALGMMNVLFALSPLPTGRATSVASGLFLAGAVLMPAVCFLAAWRKPLRHLFFLPVAALVLAVVFTLVGGL